ncbi:PREDICTED: uncharacterized protein LOC105110695 [Populus euphratica]|uniref:Uncharacterized protein LOC105110695 n=1 Tax=Populus euphratica TaxID=75702 RepID=A0AAJ6X3J7_POPEU|nr:PREDICTED: uncharacterized protein LOC105110695 [Populus euphratica]
MPQVDLETLVSACAGGTCDSKIACETLAAATTTTNKNNYHSLPPPPPDSPDVAEVPPDFPPESFWLSKDAELDWFNTNAYYERKDSTKGNSNSANLNPNLIPNPTHNSSNSQRFSSFHSKASIIGLPKTQKSTFVVDTKKRRICKHGNTRLFPKRSGSTGKSDPTGMIEPSSPKVSCMGRVRSKKDRRRLRKKQLQQQEQLSFQATGKKESTRKDKKKEAGFFASLKAIFRCKSDIKDISHRTTRNIDTSYGGSVSESYTFKKSSDIRDRLPASDRDAPHRRSFGMEPLAAEPVVGLGGMTRFASGRRSESWSVEIGVA